MSKNKNRQLFSFSLTAAEKESIDRSAAANAMTRSAYCRYKIFQPDPVEIKSSRNPLTNNAVPEVNVKTYQTLKEISEKLDRLNELANSHNRLDKNRISVDSELLEETLNLVNEIGLKLAIQSAKF